MKIEGYLQTAEISPGLKWRHSPSPHLLKTPKSQERKLDPKYEDPC